MYLILILNWAVFNYPVNGSMASNIIITSSYIQKKQLES